MINDKVLQLIPDSIQFWIKVEILASRQPIIENEIFIWEVTGYNWSIIKTEFLGGKITLYSWNIMCSRCISSVLGDEIFKHFQGEHAPGSPPQNLHKGRSLGQNKNASQFVNIFSWIRASELACKKLGLQTMKTDLELCHCPWSANIYGSFIWSLINWT